MMTGSGSAVFGLFEDAGAAARARAALAKMTEPARLYRVSLVNRKQYRSLWWRALGDYTNGKTWPPRNRD
jgi:hypothetical protein